jgi:hypothetical protein
MSADVGATFEQGRVRPSENVTEARRLTARKTSVSNIAPPRGVIRNKSTSADDAKELLYRERQAPFSSQSSPESEKTAMA